MTQPSDPNAQQPWPGGPPPAPGYPPYGAPAGGPPPAPGYPYPGAPPAGYGQPAPGVPPGMYYDPASGLTLPEGVVLATIGRRIGAYFLAIVLWVVTLFIGYIIWGLIAWGSGRTPVQQVLGLRCWNPESGRPAGWWRMALRQIIGGICEGILGWITQLVSFILFLTRKDRRCLHDLVGGTVVIYDPHKVLPR